MSECDGLSVPSRCPSPFFSLHFWSHDGEVFMSCDLQGTGASPGVFCQNEDCHPRMGLGGAWESAWIAVWVEFAVLWASLGRARLRFTRGFSRTEE